MGHSVIGYDLDLKKVEEASVYGVRAGKSPADVASQSDIVMLCVTSTAGGIDASKIEAPQLRMICTTSP